MYLPSPSGLWCHVCLLAGAGRTRQGVLAMCVLTVVSCLLSGAERTRQGVLAMCACTDCGVMSVWCEV